METIIYQLEKSIESLEIQIKLQKNLLEDLKSKVKVEKEHTKK